MNNVEIEIYMNRFINFFENNPNDLMGLIGELDKNEFYELVRYQCTENIEKGDEVSLTQDQIIDIVIRLKKKDLDKSRMIVIVDKVFQHTKFGLIGLN